MLFFQWLGHERERYECGRSHYDREFLAQFTHQRRLRRLTGLDLAAWKLPQAPKCALGWTLLNQYVAPRIDQRCRHHENHSIVRKGFVNCRPLIHFAAAVGLRFGRGQSMMKRLMRLARDRRGGTAIEYGLIAALIIITMMVALKNFAGVSVNMWQNVSNKMQNPV